MGEQVEMRLLTMGNSEMFDRLKYSPFDIGFIYSASGRSHLLNHVLEKHGLQFTPMCPAAPAIYIGGKHPLMKERKFSREQVQELNFFKLDYDYRERYSDLWETIRSYGLEKKLEHACVVNGGYGITQMLENSAFAYLGHVWLSEGYVKPTVVKLKEIAVYGNYALLDSADGDITMGYISHRGMSSVYIQELIDMMKEVCRLKH